MNFWTSIYRRSDFKLDRDGEKLKFEESAEAINNTREAFLSLQPHLRLLDGELPQEQVTAKMVEIIDAAGSMHT